MCCFLLALELSVSSLVFPQVTENPTSKTEVHRFGWLLSCSLRSYHTERIGFRSVL